MGCFGVCSLSSEEEEEDVDDDDGDGDWLLLPKPNVRLLQSPWEAAQARKQRRMTSVTRWLVRTLPPTTAAPSEGERMDRGGMRTVMGARQPWLRGMSAEMRQRRQ